MAYKLSDGEYHSARGLDLDERYQYFVEKVAESGQVWSLRSASGWVVMTTEDDEECLPVWPHADFAADWATADWSDCVPEAVELDVWLERWSPGMAEDGTLVAVFPVDEEEGLVLKPNELREAIEMELAER